ncbi:helix-turn-helix domain-containing protein [Paraburkholderia caribensis]|uniref:helix-turn-helix domain-containing protein n=1 Tax=Paraburkholderia caribensis TaxID=75105 RepID=UPI001CC792D4|nr:helix-turn-helix transcriptional regulator [Paraburkholderia caribensis]
MVKKAARDEGRAANERLSTGLKTARLAAGLSLVALANLTGMSRNTLWRIENRSSNARLSTIDTLAECFQVNPSQLLAERPAYGRLKRRLPLPELVARNIAQHRADAGLSQESLGSAAGLAKNYASLIEVSAPDLTIETVGSIARVLGVDASLLLADPREGAS